jgi:hypothetical protein
MMMLLLLLLLLLWRGVAMLVRRITAMPVQIVTVAHVIVTVFSAI